MSSDLAEGKLIART